MTAGERAAYVREMFDAIAPRYDLLNSLLSAGIHRGWRRFATRCAALQPGDSVLDVCTGTGDWAAELRKTVGPRGRVVGVDFSLPMLRHGDRRFRAAGVGRAQGDAAWLPFASDTFDAATVAFGIRNVAEMGTALAEMARVVRPGGRVVCLEFAEPHPGLFKGLYVLYSRWVMPAVGGAISGRREAYAYLPASVARFASRARLAETLQDVGLADVRWVDLTFGMVCVHVGVKPEGEAWRWRP
ncbi:MAG: bifunctional demethylmenaquinone methyltransferase/2-methoxy-6-polyprenyl-1,4-benzoquinol methylase UbiE [Armatimonadetes bacterium]|nr:bifunctional demethylmenaquinone methyltransferase/2-methoxy-6-polyprenyl-1,4-benzoquinol methylase UbiE [Armatimonadota bacterium]